MKKFTTLIISLFLFTNICLSQSGWFWQNPLPQGNDLYSINAVNANLIYTVGDAGTVLKSTNGGMNWTGNYYSAGIGNDYYRYVKPIYTVFFVNSNTGFFGTNYWPTSSGVSCTNNIYRTSMVD